MHAPLLGSSHAALCARGLGAAATSLARSAKATCLAPYARVKQRRQITSSAADLGDIPVNPLTTLLGMPLEYAPPIVINPSDGSTPTAAVIFLHGLGDSGAGWAEVASQFQASLKHARFIFPNAPKRSITVNWGMAMPGWFDIASLEDVNQKQDEEGLNESMRYIKGLLDEQTNSGIPPSRVAVCGFSQGGAMALLMLRSNVKLAAVVGLSSWLPLSNAEVVLSPENKDTPILMCHGDSDQVVSYRFGRDSHAKLDSLGAKAEFATYTGMQHSACPQELKDIENFLIKNLPAK